MVASAVHAAYILRLKPTALSFMSAALVLVFENVNAVLFFKRSDAAKRTFGHTRITVTLAGEVYAPYTALD